MGENIKISSISDYVSLIESKIQKLKNIDEKIDIWFRGEPIYQSNLTPLIPKAYRLYNDPIDEAYIQTKRIEPNLKAEFKTQTLPYFISKNIPINDWNTYFMMVHYGLKTRLLDWTQSALIALFFAVENLSENDDAIVWLMNPHKLNKYSTSLLNKNNSGFSGIPIPRDTDSQLLFDEENRINSEELCRIYLNMDFDNKIDTKKLFYPLAIIPTLLDERMSMQQSCFTIYGDKVNGLLDINMNEMFLDSVIIDKYAKRSIKEALRWLGITQKIIYPGLEGISKSIEDKYNMDDYILKRIK